MRAHAMPANEVALGCDLESFMAEVPIKSCDTLRWWHLLLIAPFVALLWSPLYNLVEPALWGIPFFYWYQFLWVILTSALIILVHNKTG
jgi:hypothetical protein